MKKTLDEFIIGQSGVITAVGGDGKIRRRLFDMGVTPGAEVVLRKKAPLGDPIEVTMRGYELTLRNTEAQAVTCECSEEEERKLIDGKEEKKQKKFGFFKNRAKGAKED
ncbi:MAG: ferrous iron transport protein A [Clostridia bacterium]|nr:ferrous iron transport protein A [Clostridia bacterium]